jgi:hypothetical protein
MTGGGDLTVGHDNPNGASLVMTVPVRGRWLDGNYPDKDRPANI